MNAHTIDILSTLNPDSVVPPITLGHLNKQQPKWSPLHDAARDRFLSTYIRTNFGFYIASQFANRRLPFPMVLTGRDLWVYKAYLMKLDPDQHFDRHVAEAYHLAQYVKDSPNLGQHLKALLLSFKDHSTPAEHLRAVTYC